MEHFKKLVNTVKIIQRFKDPNEDIFRSIRVPLIIAGINYEPTKKWQHIFWKGYQLLAACQLLIMLLSTIEHIQSDDVDIVVAVWYPITFFELLVGVGQHLILRQCWSSIQRAVVFINGRPSSSSNTLNDSTVRRKLARKIQLMSLGLVGVMTTCVMLAPVMVFKNKDLYRLPQFLKPSEEWVSSAVHFVYISTLFPIWILKKLMSTVLVSALLSGFETELRILIDGFKEYPHQDEPNWKLLTKHVRVYIQQHSELLENLSQLRPVLSKSFLVIYYHTTIISGIMTYLTLLDGISAGSFIHVMAIVNYCAECYWWSHLADSFKSHCETFDQHIFNLIAKLSYNPDRHSDYVQLRTALMIMKFNVRRSASFSCAGLFCISLQKFVALLQTVYTFFMFLLNIDPGNSANSNI